MKKSASKRSPRRVYGEKHIIGFLFFNCLLLTLFLITLLGAMVALRIPDIRTVAHYQPLQTSYILDSRGNTLERIYKENRSVVPLGMMPEYLPEAFVAAEDGRFFEHPGLDFFSVLRAVFVNIKRGGKAHGGSTITQQVARSLLLTREKTYLRKFKEAILAWRIDSLLSKEDILYIYLNQIYLGGGAHGVEAAAQVYFNKHVDQLTLGEAATLAGLPQAPSKYSPFKNPELAAKRQRYVLNRMAADGHITRTQARDAYEGGIELRKQPFEMDVESGYYTDIVKKRAARQLGKSLMRAGVRIHTHLDPMMQVAAVSAVRSGVMQSFRRSGAEKKAKRKVPQGALVSIEGCSGEVKAMVGGNHFATTRYNRAAFAKRQAGSAFKPIVFSAALENGWSGNSLILDAPLSIPGGGRGRWKPQNYSGKYHGEVTLTEALAHSYNTAAVRLLQQVGLNPVHELSDEMGIHSEMPGDLSLALGSVEVTLLDMTSAYTHFICDGQSAPPRFIDRIEAGDGRVIVQTRVETKRVLSRKTARQLKGMMQEVIASGTGRLAQGLPGKNGGKTGTSNDSRDAWFIGFHDTNMTGVWVGHDQNSSLGKGENGGKTAAPIWREFMQSGYSSAR